MEFESKRGSLCWGAARAEAQEKGKGGWCGLVWVTRKQPKSAGAERVLIRLLCSIAEQKLGAFEKERGRGNLPAWSIREKVESRQEYSSGGVVKRKNHGRPPRSDED